MQRILTAKHTTRVNHYVTQAKKAALAVDESNEAHAIARLQLQAAIAYEQDNLVESTSFVELMPEDPDANVARAAITYKEGRNKDLQDLIMSFLGNTLSYEVLT